jgi:hypothetical protein
MKAQKSSTPKRAKKSPTKPISQAQPPETEVIWKYITPLDISLEHQPVFRKLEPGERTLELAVQTHFADLPQENLTELKLSLKAQILLADKPIIVAELLYLGVAEKPKNPRSAEILSDELYREVRYALQLLLQATGHNPPLPAALKEI